MSSHVVPCMRCLAQRTAVLWQRALCKLLLLHMMRHLVQPAAVPMHCCLPAVLLPPCPRPCRVDNLWHHVAVTWRWDSGEVRGRAALRLAGTCPNIEWPAEAAMPPLPRRPRSRVSASASRCSSRCHPMPTGLRP